ncbi:MAG: phytanoyl-CoA dioxygenase family protein [Gammaproteobacteria bacterium]
MLAVEVTHSILELENKGWFKVDRCFDLHLINRICEEWDNIRPYYESIQRSKGIFSATKNTTHHNIINMPSLLELLEVNPLRNFLQDFFNGPYILNTMGISEITYGADTYTQKIHRDVRSFDGACNLWINTLVLLDDFDEDNGPTLILGGSHMMKEKPSAELFKRDATSVAGSAGDVIVFHGNVWHAAGENNSRTRRRRALTPFFSKPFIKQQLDYAEYFGDSKVELKTEYIKQVLGLNARVPKCVEDFYQPDDLRFYKSDQG